MKETIEKKIKRETRINKSGEKLSKLVSKEDLYNYYIIENHRSIEVAEHFNLKNYQLSNLLHYYKITKSPKLSAKYKRNTRSHQSYVNGGKKSSSTQKKNWELKSNEFKEQWKDKCKDVVNSQEVKNKISNSIKLQWNSLTNEEKEIIRKHQSESHKKSWKDNKDSILSKRETTIKNNRKDNLCKSQEEQSVFNKLIELYDDLQYNVRVDDRYPYYVDFYIKSLDLFIEYQGHPSHGIVPYKFNDESTRLVDNWLDTYTKRDVNKYNKAIESNINLIRIYPHTTLENNFKINDNKFNDIVSIIYNINK